MSGADLEEQAFEALERILSSPAADAAFTVSAERREHYEAGVRHLQEALAHFAAGAEGDDEGLLTAGHLGDYVARTMFEGERDSLHEALGAIRVPSNAWIVDRFNGYARDLASGEMAAVDGQQRLIAAAAAVERLEREVPAVADTRPVSAAPVVALPVRVRLEMSIGQEVGGVSDYEEVAQVPAAQVLADPHAVRRAVWQALGRVALAIAEEVEALAEETKP